MSGGEGADIEALKVALLKVEGNRPDYPGIRTQWYRNPEGPEAWAVIEALQVERDDYEQLSRAASGEADVLRARIAELEAELAGAKGLLSECPRLLECVERYSLDAIVESLIDRINAYLAEPRS
jgi:hypothetical protein